MNHSIQTAIADPKPISGLLHHRVVPQHSQLHLQLPGDHRRAEVESYIYQCFAEQYQAHIDHFLPNLVTLQCNHHISAAVGFGNAAETPLFVEQYFERSLEQAVSAALCQPIDRSQIAEIGNLASNRRGSAYLLFCVIAHLLYRMGYQWMVFTATPQVEKLLRRMGLEPIALATADPAKLGDKAELWGSYYQVKPTVFVGSLSQGRKAIEQNPQLCHLTGFLEPHMNQLLTRLSK